MKEELLKILIYLKETNSWDLAEELAKWVYKNNNIDVGLIDSLIYSINIVIKKSNLTGRGKKLIKARDMMIELRTKEQQEREEEQNELESLLEF